MSERTIESAREIVDTAIKYKVWSWDDPGAVTDDAVRAKADEIAEVALNASKTGSVNDAVLAILFAAQVEPASDASREAFQKRFGTPSSNGAAQERPAEQQSAFAQAPAESAPEPETSGPSTEEIDAIFPGYDTFKAKQIVDAIVASVASGDFTPEDWEKIKAYEAANDERKPILELEPEFKQPAPEPQPAEQAAPQRAVEPGDYGTNEGMETFYSGQAQTRAQQEKLPIPPSPDGDQPVLPIDITTVGDQDLSRVATQFHSLFARTQWLISQEEGRERAAEALESEAHRDAFASAVARHESAIPADKRNATAMENARRQAGHDADAAEPVRVWRNRKIRHGIEARELKALATGYDKGVWRINEELQRRARLSTTGRAS